MRTFLIKTPWWLKALYPKRTWHMDRREKKIYLSFDDGPHPVATPFVLDQLKKYNAKASFFCIGKNVAAYPSLYSRILEEGHTVGNHTQDHLNGWKTTTDDYLRNVKAAEKWIKSGLFRPPYGRIRSVSAERCYQHVVRHTNNGSIVVFHDSEKAWDKMSNTLPLVLEHFSKKGFQFSAILEGKNAGTV
jgi:peptidoglycan/xylan/chitin deacetylase (PgdA/CDA1 family)